MQYSITYQINDFCTAEKQQERMQSTVFPINYN